MLRQPDQLAGDARDRRRDPGLRRVLVSYFRDASLRCQAGSVAGVTAKIGRHKIAELKSFGQVAIGLQAPALLGFRRDRCRWSWVRARRRGRPGRTVRCGR